MKWKMLVFADGVYFAGEEHLVKSPDDARWFNSYSEAAEQSKDIVALNPLGVSQIRLISEAFAKHSTPQTT